MRHLIIAILFLLPFTVSAQLLRSYGVVEIGATFPTSTSTGAKFAYRTTDSSFYRWIVGNTWVKVLPVTAATPDTLYLKQLSGTTALVDGDTIDISTYLLKTDTTYFLNPYIRLAGYGLLKTLHTLTVDTSLVSTKTYTNRFLLKSDTTTAFASYLKRPVGWGLSLLSGKYPFVDSSKVASRYYAGTNPTTIASGYLATSNGNNLVARNLFDNNTYVGILNSKPFAFGQWTTAGRPTGVTGYEGYNTTGNGKEWYNGTRWAYALESTFARGTAGSVFFADANGQVGQNNSNFFWDNTNGRLGIGTASPAFPFIVAKAGTQVGGSNFYVTTGIQDGTTVKGFVLGYNNSDNSGIIAGNAQDVAIWSFNGSTWGESMRVRRTNGHVGVGVTTPAYPITIGKAGVQLGGSNYYGSLGVQDAGTTKGLVLGYNNSDNSGIISGNLQDVTIWGYNGSAWAEHMRMYRLTGNASLLVGSFGIKTTSPLQELDVNGDIYIRDSTRLATTPTHSSITGLLTRDANGWVGLATVGTGLSYSGGVLSATGTADGNGIYSGSGTLASHTTRARIPSTGNLLFSQTYNSTDSAYIQVINNLDGNREVRLGLTDTVTTGYANLRLFQDEPNESMGFEFRTEDSYGGTTLKGENGGLSMYADNTLEMRGTEIRLNNGEVLMNQYGQGNMKSTDLGVSDSKYVAKFSTNGRVTDYYLARDTFIEDVTLFSVGTLMYECQELTIVSSMTVLAESDQEIRFPDASDALRGKKIIVYIKKKEGGLYLPKIKVVGGVSRLYFTTDPGTGGTDPSDQSELLVDDTNWSYHGATYEFTCLKIDNAPSYRWVLKQR